MLDKMPHSSFSCDISTYYLFINIIIINVNTLIYR